MGSISLRCMFGELDPVVGQDTQCRLVTWRSDLLETSCCDHRHDDQEAGSPGRQGGKKHRNARLVVDLVLMMNMRMEIIMKIMMMIMTIMAMHSDTVHFDITS